MKMLYKNVSSESSLEMEKYKAPKPRKLLTVKRQKLIAILILTALFVAVPLSMILNSAPKDVRNLAVFP